MNLDRRLIMFARGRMVASLDEPGSQVATNDPLTPTIADPLAELHRRIELFCRPLGLAGPKIQYSKVASHLAKIVMVPLGLTDGDRPKVVASSLINISDPRR